MAIKLDFMEISILSILFTILALYLNIHKEQHVYSFAINHIIALLISVLISKLIYTSLMKRK